MQITNVVVSCAAMRVIRVVFWICLLLAGPLSVAVAVVSEHTLGSVDLGFVAAGFITAVLLMLFGVLATARCPNCRYKLPIGNAFWPRQCQKCACRC
jgi:hypothetical protein